MMTSDQALAGLGALVGGGGLSAVLVALFGFLTEARKGRKPTDRAVKVAMGPDLDRDRWGEIGAGHLGTLAHTLARAVAILEVEAEERFDGKDFHERLDNKLWRALWPREGPGPAKP